jgi:hypothetical protein
LHLPAYIIHACDDIVYRICAHEERQKRIHITLKGIPPTERYDYIVQPMGFSLATERDSVVARGGESVDLCVTVSITSHYYRRWQMIIVIIGIRCNP